MRKLCNCKNLYLSSIPTKKTCKFVDDIQKYYNDLKTYLDHSQFMIKSEAFVKNH